MTPFIASLDQRMNRLNQQGSLPVETRRSLAEAFHVLSGCMKQCFIALSPLLFRQSTGFFVFPILQTHLERSSLADERID